MISAFISHSIQIPSSFSFYQLRGKFRVIWWRPCCHLTKKFDTKFHSIFRQKFSFLFSPIVCSSPNRWEKRPNRKRLFFFLINCIAINIIILRSSFSINHSSLCIRNLFFAMSHFLYSELMRVQYHILSLTYDLYLVYVTVYKYYRIDIHSIRFNMEKLKIFLSITEKHTYIVRICAHILNEYFKWKFWWSNLCKTFDECFVSRWKYP